MTANRNSDNVPPVLFRLQEENIGVNSAQTETAMRCQEQLHLYVINVSRETLTLSGASGFYIELNVTIGEGSGNMFAPRDTAGWGMIESTDCFVCKGWQTHPLKKNSLYCILELRMEQEVQLTPGAGLSFHWKRIISTAPEGYSAIQANLFGLDDTGGRKVSLSDYIFKKTVIPRIVRFSVSPSCGAPGQQVTLSWRVENADKGMLLPDGCDIMGTVPQQSGSRVITLGEETDRYYLNIIGDGIGVFQETHVFLTPPVISALYIEEHRRLCWETHFASRVLLAQQGEVSNNPKRRSEKETQFEEVGAGGTRLLQDGATCVWLRCEGLYRMERQLIIPPASDIVTIYAEYLTYRRHRSVRLVWKTAGMKEFTVVVGDGDSYILSTELNGTWEQIYPATTRIAFIFCYVTVDGKEVQVQLEKEGD